MEICGKKQVDIREDNKSAVIDLLLKSEMTVLGMSEALDLSHTAIAKVIKELVQKNVVQVVESSSPSFGRPPKIYRINGDCAIACAVMISRRKIYVYYFDMRGFQINSSITENNFENPDDMIGFIAEKIVSLKNHPRLENKILKYIYVGVPADGVCGESFVSVTKKIDTVFLQRFADIRTVIQCNTNYQLIAELKYGVLKNGKRNAILVDFDRNVNAALLLDGRIYRGNNDQQGRFLNGKNIFLEKVSDGENNAPDTTRETENMLRPILGELADIIKFLDISNVVFSGEVKELGERFIDFAKNEVGQGVECVFSSMGKNIPAALSGAVWQSTYSTLMKVMLRE